jgi:hypothetical protein
MTDVYFCGELMDKSLVNLTLEMEANNPEIQRKLKEEQERKKQQLQQ